MTLLLALTMLAGVETGNGSRYGYEGDRFDVVGTFACRRTLTARYGTKVWQQMRAHGVAHRTLPCGTRLGICHPRTGLCTTAFVVDRGPWGALNRKGEWHVRTGKLRPGEHYRGVLDLLPGVYSAIDLRGIEKVVFWELPDAGWNKSIRDHGLPPLRSHGPSPFASYVTPDHKSSPFPPLRANPAPVFLVSTANPIVVATASLKPATATTFAFPPLRDATFPKPSTPVQSRFGQGQSYRSPANPSPRLPPANS